MSRKETPAEFRERMRSIGYMPGGRSKKRGVKEYRRADGTRVKQTTDELNNTVTEHATKDDRVDVMIRPETVYMDMKAN